MAAAPIARPHATATAFWIVATRLLMLLAFAQSVFAGLLLSGEGWGRTAHRLTALGLVGGALLLGVVATVTLRHVAGGPRLATSLLALGLTLAAQMGIGLLSANGERLLWLHIPLGVALIGFAADVATSTRRLGEPDQPAQSGAPEHRRTT